MTAPDWKVRKILASAEAWGLDPEELKKQLLKKKSKDKW